MTPQVFQKHAETQENRPLRRRTQTTRSAGRAEGEETVVEWVVRVDSGMVAKEVEMGEGGVVKTVEEEVVKSGKEEVRGVVRKE